MTYFDQIDPIKDIFDHISVHKPDWNNFQKPLGTKLLDKFPKILTYDGILAPIFCQNDPILTIFIKNDLFSRKMAYFDQIEPINDIFDHRYVNKSD